MVDSRPPVAGPEQVLRYLSLYTHRAAISNRRLVAADEGDIAFRWKNYREDGRARWKTMTLGAHEFIRRFLVHVLPKGFHRIRHYGLLAKLGGDITRPDAAESTEKGVSALPGRVLSRAHEGAASIVPESASAPAQIISLDTRLETP